MKKINIRRLYYNFSRKYLTLNNVVMAIALMIAAGWVWGSLGVMQRNYNLQKEVDLKAQQLQLAQLETANMQLEQRYYKTTEYQELAARQSLGLAKPGEKVLILPNNSPAVIAADQASTIQVTAPDLPLSNFQQWANFFFGANNKSSSN
jgi:cell division protein FtsB